MEEQTSPPSRSQIDVRGGEGGVCTLLSIFNRRGHCRGKHRLGVRRPGLRPGPGTDWLCDPRASEPASLVSASRACEGWLPCCPGPERLRRWSRLIRNGPCQQSHTAPAGPHPPVAQTEKGSDSHRCRQESTGQQGRWHAGHALPTRKLRSLPRFTDGETEAQKS